MPKSTLPFPAPTYISSGSSVDTPLSPSIFLIASGQKLANTLQDITFLSLSVQTSVQPKLTFVQDFSSNRALAFL